MDLNVTIYHVPILHGDISIWKCQNCRWFYKLIVYEVQILCTSDKYCHVPRYPWQEITGLRLRRSFYWTSRRQSQFQSLGHNFFQTTRPDYSIVFDLPSDLIFALVRTYLSSPSLTPLTQFFQFSCAPTLTYWLGPLGLPRWLTGLDLLGSHADWLAWASWAPTLTDWVGPLALPRWLTDFGLLGSHADWLAWASCAPTLTDLGFLGSHADWLTLASWAPTLTHWL
jgi:hypothetical protein